MPLVHAFKVFLENTHSNALHMPCNDTNNTQSGWVYSGIWDNIKPCDIDSLKSS